MSIEIGNALHAMAIVAPTSAGPAFLGQGNVGFAPFGNGPTLSESLGTGRVRLRLLDAINFAVGEGVVLTNLFVTSPSFPLNSGLDIHISLPPLISGFDTADILVQTTNEGTFSDNAFMVAVLRLPQQSTG